METIKFSISKNAIEIINAGLDLVHSKTLDDNIHWNESDIKTVLTMIDIIGINTGLFFPDVQFEKEQNLDSSLVNLDSKP